jgi:hypothetical protein
MTRNELEDASISLKSTLKSISGEVIRLKSEYHNAQVTESFLVDLSNSLSTKQYTKVLNEWDKKKSLVNKYLLNSSEFDVKIEIIIDELKKQRAIDIQDFVHKFPISAQSCGIQIDSNSRHPNYFLINGFFQVGVNEKKYEVSIAPRMGKVIIVGPELNVILEILTSEIKRIFERDWDVSVFRDNLIEIYKSISPRNSQSSNSEVSIKSIMKEFKSKHKLGNDEFLVDFSRLLKEDKGIQLANTRDSANGIQIVGSESNGYYGYMKIEGLK